MQMLLFTFQKFYGFVLPHRSMMVYFRGRFHRPLQRSDLHSNIVLCVMFVNTVIENTAITANYIVHVLTAFQVPRLSFLLFHRYKLLKPYHAIFINVKNVEQLIELNSPEAHTKPLEALYKPLPVYGHPQRTEVVSGDDSEQVDQSPTSAVDKRQKLLHHNGCLGSVPPQGCWHSGYWSSTFDDCTPQASEPCSFLSQHLQFSQTCLV